jgi:hypothetical protein
LPRPAVWTEAVLPIHGPVKSFGRVGPSPLATILTPSNEVKVPSPVQWAVAGWLNLSRAVRTAFAPFVPFFPPMSKVSATTLPFFFRPLLSTPWQPVGQATVNRPPVLSP